MFQVFLWGYTRLLLRMDIGNLRVRFEAAFPQLLAHIITLCLCVFMM